MSEPSITIVDLIRHGEPVGGRRYRGHIDDPLSEKGWSQMRDTVKDHKPWNAVVSSPLTRCLEFAKEVSQRHNLPLAIDERFKEIRWGIWEGNTPAEIAEKYPDALQRQRANPLENVPQGAERPGDFRSRIVTAWQDLLQNYTGQHVLLVAHAGVTRAVMCHALSIPTENMFQIHVDNARVTRFHVEQQGEQSFHRLMHHNGGV
ncbi:histidine phosphatase family protein [Kaarinaea lacus]